MDGILTAIVYGLWLTYIVSVRLTCYVCSCLLVLR